MTTATGAPVATLATDLERLAEMFNSGELDGTEVFLFLAEMLPGLFGEDLWDAWLPYVAAIKRLDAFRIAGLDAHAQAVQNEAADAALKVLLAAAVPADAHQEVGA